jgi:hypothetical protein
MKLVPFARPTNWENALQQVFVYLATIPEKFIFLRRAEFARKDSCTGEKMWRWRYLKPMIPQDGFQKLSKRYNRTTGTNPFKNRSKI